MRALLGTWPRGLGLNDCSKLKGQRTDVKSGCVTSVGSSPTPHSLSLQQKSRATVPLRAFLFCCRILYAIGYKDVFRGKTTFFNFLNFLSC